MNEAITAYPLCWPPGRPNTTNKKRSRFEGWPLGRARDNLTMELRRLGARNIIISSNIPTKQNGELRADGKCHGSCGVAVYFDYKGRQVCFACDRWDSVACNVHAIELTITALRGIARWGTGDMVDAAFTGFEALPAARMSVRPWRQVLELIQDNPTLLQAEAAYARLAMFRHPDRGGSQEQMAELNDAIEKARKELA